MAQHIRQLHDVTAGPVKGRGEQMAKVVGKDLAGRDPRRLAQPLHLRPDLTAAEGRPVSGEKDLAGSGFLLFGVFQLGMRMVRILPFRATSARPALAASTVIYCTSLTRMPVAQMASINRASRVLFCAFAAAVRAL